VQAVTADRQGRGRYDGQGQCIGQCYREGRGPYEGQLGRGRARDRDRARSLKRRSPAHILHDIARLHSPPKA